MPNGWPFGLGNMNTRLIVTETVEEAVAGASEPNTLHGPSSSFSSFLSSNFDTEVIWFQQNPYFIWITVHLYLLWSSYLIIWFSSFGYTDS